MKSILVLASLLLGSLPTSAQGVSPTLIPWSSLVAQEVHTAPEFSLSERGLLSLPLARDIYGMFVSVRESILERTAITTNLRWWVTMKGPVGRFEWMVGITFTYAHESYLTLFYDKRDVALWIRVFYTI